MTIKLLTGGLGKDVVDLINVSRNELSSSKEEGYNHD